MHYSNFIKTSNKLALNPAVVISGGATTTAVYESEAASDIKELKEYNNSMKAMLDDTTEFDAIDEAIQNANIMSTGVLDNISNIESGFKTAVKDVKTDDSKYPDMDPDNIELLEDEADTEDATEDAGEASESTEAPEVEEAGEAAEAPSATFTISPATNKWDIVTSTNSTSLTASSIDTNSLVSKIINGGNGRVVSSVPIDAAPETNHNPFENNERDTNETTEAAPKAKPVEAKADEKPAKEHPLVALFKNPEDIYRITTVLEHAKALAEAENPANGTVNLSQEEMEFVMGLLMDLGEKYFSDIPLVDTPDYWFIANIPVEMYNAILSWYNQSDVPDILNPVVTLYISMCEEPELAYGRYLRILDSYMFDHTNLINKLNAEYKKAKQIDTDDEDAAEDDLIETIDDEDEGDE